MIRKINQPVAVTVFFDGSDQRILPKTIIWNNNSYPINKVGLHHTYKVGESLFHIFTVQSRYLAFRLKLDTQSLRWTLEEISDGLS